MKFEPLPNLVGGISQTKVTFTHHQQSVKNVSTTSAMLDRSALRKSALYWIMQLGKTRKFFDR